MSISDQLNPNYEKRENQNRIVETVKSADKKDMSAILRALGQSLDNALSPFIYESYGEELDYKTYVEESPKIHYTCECIREVKKWHEQRNESVSGQVIYMNRGKEFFDFIREYLNTEVGFKEEVFYETVDDKDRPKKYKLNEVEIISSEISEDKKEMIKDAFLQGIVKVIIGTATIREGIDLQKKGTVVYDCYPDWNPTDIKQLEGRIWRQGNEFGYVRIVMPLVRDSMDIFVFQKLEEKTSRINDIWDRADRGNVLDLESLDPQEVKLALFTDIGRLVKLFFDQAKDEFDKRYRRAKNALHIIEEVQTDINRYRSLRTTMLEIVKDFYDELKEHDIFEEKTFTNDVLRKDHKKEVDKAKEVLLQFEKFLTASQQDDKDLLALLRRVENNDYRIYPSGTYQINYFKEYLSKVRKTEKTYLIPKKMTIDSDLTEAIKTFQADIDILEAEKKLFTCDENGEVVATTECVKWKQLEAEVIEKKSTLAVEAKSVMERVQDFARLNYLLAYKMGTVPSCGIPEPGGNPYPETYSDLELEAEALALELELLEL